MSFKGFVDGAKAVVRNLPQIRKEIVAAATAAVSIIALFEVTFPSVSAAHLALFSGVTAALTAVASFLSNNRVVEEVNWVSGQPVWRAKLKYLVKHDPGRT
jgi:hypothetical protein